MVFVDFGAPQPLAEFILNDPAWDCEASADSPIAGDPFPASSPTPAAPCGPDFRLAKRRGFSKASIAMQAQDSSALRDKPQGFAAYRRHVPWINHTDWCCLRFILGKPGMIPDVERFTSSRGVPRALHRPCRRRSATSLGP